VSREKGVIIGQACEILRKTYREIDRFKDDITELLSDYEPSMRYVEEHSYGGRYLHLRANHTYLFKRTPEESEIEGAREERVLSVTCIFYEEGNLNRVNLKDQPELWIGLLNISNEKEQCKSWHIRDTLSLNKRKYFIDGELRIGGDVLKYHWADEREQEEKEEWTGVFIGYPLVDITNRDVLKAKIMDKLFPVPDQAES